MLYSKKTNCYYPGCNLRAISECRCSSPYTYMCAGHTEIHLNALSSNHELILLPTNIIEGSKKWRAIATINKLLSDLKAITKESIKACSEIIEKVNEGLKKLLGQIKEVERALCEAKSMILFHKPVDNDFALELLEAGKITFVIQNKEILNLIDDILAFDVITNNDVNEDYALFAKTAHKNLNFVNLSTFKKSTFTKSSKNWGFAAGCRISNNKYFLTGGYDGSTFYKHASIINLNNNTEEILPESSIRNHTFGCICKNNQVYTFGGYNSTDIISAQRFDLSKKTWSSIPNIPVASSIFATVIEHKIVITGYALGCAYVFDNNNYTKNIILPTSVYYVACEKWIFNPTELYECLSLEEVKWKKYTIKIRGGFYPAIWVTHRREGFIYYISQDDILWRIDTVSKSVKEVNYS